jgi:hypothetical protein
VALVMGGGYGRLIEETVDVQVSTWREALRAWHGYARR